MKKSTREEELQIEYEAKLRAYEKELREARKEEVEKNFHIREDKRKELEHLLASGVKPKDLFNPKKKLKAEE